MGIQGEALSNESLRRLLTTTHGIAGGPTCLMELFPLPCKDAGSWVYDKVLFDEQVPENDFLTKKSYYKAYLPSRVETLKTLLNKHNPEVLVCMTWSHRDSIIPLMDSHKTIDLELPNCNGSAIIGMCGQTVMVICTHLGARGFRGPLSRFYYAIGQAIRGRMEELKAIS